MNCVHEVAALTVVLAFSFVGMGKSETCGNKVIRLETMEPVLVDFGPDGTAGYPEIEARPVRGNLKVRLSYGCYPAFGRNGDFWRETSARYLCKDFDLPILPANINRYDVFTVTNAGTYASPLQQGLQRYVRVQLEEPNAAVDVSAIRFVNRGTHSEESVVGSFSCSVLRPRSRTEGEGRIG